MVQGSRNQAADQGVRGRNIHVLRLREGLEPEEEGKFHLQVPVCTGSVIIYRIKAVTIGICYLKGFGYTDIYIIILYII